MRRLRSESGSVLVIVIIVFAVTLLLGTGLLKLVTMSHSYALRQKENQQAYYAAKSALDTVLAYIDNLTLTEQDARIGPTGDMINQIGTVGPFYDDQGKEWVCTVEVRRVGDTVEMIGKSDNRKGTTGKIIAEFKKELSARNSSLISHNTINVDSREGLDIVEIATVGGAINIHVDESLSSQAVNSHGAVTLSANEHMTTGDIITAGAAAGENISAQGNLSLSVANVFGKDIALQSTNGPLKVGGLIKATSKLSLKGNSIELNDDIYATGPIEIDLTDLGEDLTKFTFKKIISDNFFIIVKHNASQPAVDELESRLKEYVFVPGGSGTPGCGIKFVKSGVETFKTCKNKDGSISIGTLPPYQTPPVLTEPTIDTVNTFYANSDIAIHQAASGHLVARFFDMTGVFKEAILYDDSVGTNSNYKFYVSNNYHVYFGAEMVVNPTTGVPDFANPSWFTDRLNLKVLNPSYANFSAINGNDKLYNIYFDSGTAHPNGVFFNDVNNLKFCGNIYTEGAGINIDERTNGLSFGSVSYVFQKYRRE